MLVPSGGAAAKPKPSWKPPSIPYGLVPEDVDDWQMYDMPGASTAAKSLSKIMEKAVTALGIGVTPHNSDKANAKIVSRLLDKMDKARYTRDDYGAADTEPRGVVQDAFEQYLGSYLDQWDFPLTFRAVNER